MRDPKRIPIVLAVVEDFWKKHPDLRLGQIISNSASPLSNVNPADIFYVDPVDIFYVEDEDVVEGIGKMDALYGVDLPAPKKP